MGEIRVLGTLEVAGDGGVIPISAAMQRKLLAALVCAVPRPCTVDALVDVLWGERAPRSARKLVQVYVSELRKALDGSIAVATEPAGYRLLPDGLTVDAAAFERLAAEAREVARENAALAVSIAERALEMWRGPAFGDLADEPVIGAEAGRLEELRLELQEIRLEGLIRTARVEEALTEAGVLARVHPLRERAQALAMLALYRAGRQAEALDVFAAFRARLDDELGLEPTPALRELQRQILNQDPVLSGESELGWSSGIPDPPNPLVGRERELEAVADLLGRRRVRLLVLTGAGGSGKTRLAVEAARRTASSYANGAAFVDLAPLREASAIPGAIARALGISDVPGELTTAALARSIGSSELLLLLDNAEHLRDGAPQFVELLARAPRLTALVTSRAVLHVSGEHVFPVPPLPLDDAAELFRQRARALHADEAFTAADDEVIERICRRVDGLPLAIELAAAWTGTLTPAALLDRLDARLGMLTRGPRDLPARQQTLRETIAWSVGLLREEERRALARLSVFPAGTTVEAAETVCDVTVDVISGLVDHHLVERAVRRGSPRLSLLETIHEYAAELLAAEPADLRRTRARLGEWARSLAEQAEPHLSRESQAEWLDVLEAEHDNLLAALDHLAAGRRPDRQLAVAVPLSRYWYVRGYLSEGRRRLEEALERGAGLPPADRRRALTAAASLALLQGDHRAATVHAESALAAAHEAGDPRFVANALSNLGAIVLAAGDHERAASALEEAVDRARALGDDRIAALAINNLGDLALTVGDYDRARPLFEESLSLLRLRGDGANIARSLFNNGAVDLMQGRVDRAGERFREGLTLSLTTGDREDLAWCLLGLAAVRVGRGDAADGAALLGAARSVLREMGADFKPFERDLDRRTEQQSRLLAGDPGHERNIERGVRMPLEAAVELALAGPTEPV